MAESIYFIVFIIIVALIFDFINGFHDAANSIATIVSTRVLSPRNAVMWAAFFNFIAFLAFETHVAKTIGKGVVEPEAVTSVVILSGLIGAIGWNILTWYLGLPTSSSHALIGGFAGGAVVHKGFAAIVFSGFMKITAFIVIAPLLGMVLGFLIMVAIYWICRRRAPQQIDRAFRKLQLVSAGLYSLGHGGNDAQKTMGIITILLFTTGRIPEFHVPLWVVLICHVAIGLGTLAGGWRIVKTMGMRITKLQPVGGFAAETGGAISLFLATAFGIPVSTTHTITGSIIGVGSLTKFSAVRWGVAGKIVWAWIFTIPCSALVAILAYYIINLFV